ncbi:MAG TPA: hypothetical protein VH306_12615 [Gaiellaceae bacterium]|jgi:hypothetical protein
MERTVRGGERRQYATAVADLWEGLGAALTRLERIAEAPPDRIAVEGWDELPSLQYHLHTGAEVALGFEPPRGGEAVHQELVAALAQARDATAQVALAVEVDDDELVERALPEWRGALFRVRLARLRALERLAVPIASDGGPERSPARRAGTMSSPAAAIAATCLAIAGAMLFTAGAVLAAWPVWAAGLALFAGGFVLFRP